MILRFIVSYQMLLRNSYQVKLQDSYFLKAIFKQTITFNSDIWSISNELSFDDRAPRQSSALEDIPVIAFERGFEAERLRSADRSVDAALREELSSNDSVFHEDSGLEISQTFENAIAAQLQEILEDHEFPNEQPDFPILLDEDDQSNQFDFNHLPAIQEEEFEENNAELPEFPMIFPDRF